MSIFEQASKLKLRFDTSRGEATVEDLWDLPLKSARNPNLDDIAIALAKQLRDNEGVQSFVDPVESKNTTAQLKFEIVKHVIDFKIAERDAEARAKIVAVQRERIKELLAKKDDEELSGKSREDLQALLASL